MSSLPKESFESFLAQLVGEQWIESFVWTSATSNSLLKTKLGKLGSGWSRTHKSDALGQAWSLDVKFARDVVIGVDLELLSDRPVLRNPQWLAARFGLPPGLTTSKNVLEEWACREAVFKACGPDNRNLVLSSFCKTSPMTYGLVNSQDWPSLEVETRVCWALDWVLAIARRSAEPMER